MEEQKIIKKKNRKGSITKLEGDFVVLQENVIYAAAYAYAVGLRKKFLCSPYM